jgi:hypothetical protein
MQYITLPSGAKVHPWRTIVRDGHLMWKHALMDEGVVTEPLELSHEAHIIKTAGRLEALAAWADHGDPDPEGFVIDSWYDPTDDDHAEGIAVIFRHSKLAGCDCYCKIKDHLQPGEDLLLIADQIRFRRC